MNNINEFISFIQGSDNDPIIKFSTINRSTRLEELHIIQIDQVESYIGINDIYFIPNIGGSKDCDIHTFTSAFIDLDCGRDNQKKFYSTEIVQAYKEQKIDEIRKFDLPPSIIVETRNGFHVYWVLSESPEECRWRDIIDKLIVKFDSDDSVSKPCQLMRLPFTKWIKPKDRLEPFDVIITEFNN